MPRDHRSPRRPVLVIAAKELRESLRDGRFRALAIAILVLLVAALAAGWLDTRQARTAIETARAADHATWHDQGPRNPHSAAHFGQFVFKPRPLLSTFDRGVDPYLGTAVRLEAHWQDPFSLRPAEDRTAVQRFGELTAAFALQVLVPLLIVITGFAAFAGERERGTLRQLASLGVARRTLVFGKALGLGAGLTLVLGPAAVLAAMLALTTGERAVQGSADESILAGAGVLALVYATYFATFLALVLAVSARARRARTALVVLLGFWMLQSVVAPRLVADLAERVHPIPSARAFFAAIAEDDARGLDGAGNRTERRQSLEAGLLESYGVASVDELPINFAGLALQASEEHANLVFDHHYGALWQRYAAQEQVHLWGALASPRLAVRSLSMAVSGTDVARHHDFAAAVEAHRRELVKLLNDDMTYNAGNADFGYLADDELWHAAPVFRDQPPSLAAALAGQRPAFAALLAWLVAAFALATVAASRLRVLPEARS
ncbi:MAG: ABC transporter permease subunit [Acidobacteriota bacterium]